MPAAPGKHSLTPTTAKAHRVERRGTASQRGYTKQWERFRLHHLRLRPLCEYCIADGLIEAASVVDHDLPHRGDAHLFWDNTFTSLCSRHHSGEKQSAEARLDGPDLLRWVRERKTKRGRQR